METRLQFDIQPQPDETTCGPTCLHAVYNYYDDKASLADVIRETPRLEEGGTLAAFLAGHALRRGYKATIYTYNLKVFDPTWFIPEAPKMPERLRARLEHKRSPKLRRAIKAYLDLLEHGGTVRFQDLTAKLIESYLVKGIPILTGLSSTYLYRCAREYGPNADYDDVRGDPAGHFVVLCGYDKKSKEILVADPLLPNPFTEDHYYQVNIDRVICAILLGVLTYDANLLVIQPKA
ncbi:MAG: C39 family peptidase [Candidatus Hydrogenedentes bacterium]|nr:C39 family peptidase [Candidatus Hydrogenedentota bacterium]